MASNPFTSGVAPVSQLPLAANILAPEIAAQQMALARKQQMAQLLMQKALEDEYGKTQMVSGWAVPNSGWGAAGKLAQMLGSMYSLRKSDEKNADLRNQLTKKLSSYLPGGQQQGQPPQMGGALIQEGDQPQAQPGQQVQQGNPVSQTQPPQMGLSGPSPDQFYGGMAAETLYGDQAGKAFWEWTKPTDASKRDRELGISNDASRQLELGKRRTDATLVMRGGNTVRDPITGEYFTAPDADSPSRILWDGDKPRVAPIEGGLDMVQAKKEAEMRGQNQQTLAPENMLNRNTDGTYNPTTVGNIIGQNQPTLPPIGSPPKYGSIDQKYGFPNGTMDSLIKVESNGNPNAVSPKGAQGLTQMMPTTQANPGFGLPRLDPNNPEHAAMYLAKMRELAGGDMTKAIGMYNAGPKGNLNNPETTAYIKNVLGRINQYSQNIQGGMPPQQQPKGAGVPFGMEKSAEGNVEVANTRYKSLVETNANAPVMLDALDNIAKYAPGAVTGAAAERREVINSLEALIPGITSAVDIQTKTNLMKKNMNRVVAAGSNVPGATDALRTIVENSNPNQHMNVPAIQEAVKQLKSVINMGIANQKVIENQKLNNDTQGVIKNNSTFVQNADPKLWHLNSLTPQEQAAYIKSLKPSEVMDLKRRYNALKQIGAF